MCTLAYVPSVWAVPLTYLCACRVGTNRVGMKIPSLEPDRGRRVIFNSYQPACVAPLRREYILIYSGVNDIQLYIIHPRSACFRPNNIHSLAANTTPDSHATQYRVMLSLTLHSQLTAHTQTQVYGVLAMMKRPCKPRELYFSARRPPASPRRLSTSISISISISIGSAPGGHGARRGRLSV